MLTPTFALGAQLLTRPVDQHEAVIGLTSTSGLTTGTRLFVDREMMAVVSLVADGVHVRRGVDGTSASPHTNGAIVLTGDANKFYDVDPAGAPPVPVLVVPYVNVKTGAIFWPEGDEAAGAQNFRWWQQIVVTYSQGTLGYRKMDITPTDVAY